MTQWLWCKLVIDQYNVTFEFKASKEIAALLCAAYILSSLAAIVLVSPLIRTKDDESK